MLDEAFSNEANIRDGAVSHEGRIGCTPANRVTPSRFKSVLLAATLAGAVAVSAAGYAIATESETPFVPGGSTGVSYEACYAYMSVAEMTESANLVVTGEVLGSSAPYPYAEKFGSGLMYYQDIYVYVDQILKGSPQSDPFGKGLVVSSAGEGLPRLEEAERATVIAIRTLVDHYGGIGASTGMSEITPGTEALFFLDRREGIYHLMLGEGSMYRSTAEGTYHDGIEGDFTLVDIADLVSLEG
ncbi:MAG: hypothetical protein IKV48_05280 [Eggerthellaceae bacterium]|nr:hypothetical protein [Eggerthellaceae bacterium]